jgi:hypothetical protein
MTEMQAIEITDGEYAILMLLSAVIQAADNFHLVQRGLKV